MKNQCETGRGWREPLSADMSFVFSEELHFNCFTALCWENWCETGREGPLSADMSFIFSRHVDWSGSFPDFHSDSLQKVSVLSIVAHCLRNAFLEPRKPLNDTWRRFFTENNWFKYCCALAAQTISWNLASILYRKHLFYVLQELSSGRLAKLIFWICAGSLQKTTALSIGAIHFLNFALK